MVRWMMTVLGLLGLGAGVLYWNRKRVGVPYRWYL
jgi:F0F1-type ATP synthase assembly protein I